MHAGHHHLSNMLIYSSLNSGNVQIGRKTNTVKVGYAVWPFDPLGHTTQCLVLAQELHTKEASTEESKYLVFAFTLSSWHWNSDSLLHFRAFEYNDSTSRLPNAHTTWNYWSHCWSQFPFKIYRAENFQYLHSSSPIYIYIYMGKTHDNYPLLRSQQTVIYLFLVRWFCGGTVITILYPKLTK